jgi:protein-tyrosine phosphatase
LQTNESVPITHAISADNTAVDGRRIPLGGTYNFRHVAGYPAADGGRIADRALWRSDALHALDDEGRRVLRDLPLRTVIDLREDSQRGERPDLVDGVGARLVAVPVYAGVFPSHDSRGAEALRDGDLSGSYLYLVRECGPRIAQVAACLAEPGALPAVVHCTGGKDRTGVVIAVVLSALGVPDDVIVADFVLSESYLDDSFVAAVRESGEASPTLGDRAIRGADPAWIIGALDEVRELHGDAATYLVDHGLAPDALGALRQALISTTPAN